MQKRASKVTANRNCSQLYHFSSAQLEGDIISEDSKILMQAFLTSSHNFVYMVPAEH